MERFAVNANLNMNPVKLGQSKNRKVVDFWTSTQSSYNCCCNISSQSIYTFSFIEEIIACSSWKNCACNCSED